jgi:hypothetical protein
MPSAFRPQLTSHLRIAHPISPTKPNLTYNKAASPKQAAPATPITGTTPTTAFAAPVPVALAALAVALLIWLEMLASMELAAEPREEVTEAALEPIADVAELTSDAMEERSVVCEPRAVPAAEVRDWASEIREERASDCARVVEVVMMARKRMVEEEESEKRIVRLVREVEFVWLFASLLWRGEGWGGLRLLVD